MAYDNIKKTISQTTARIIVMWTMLFAAMIGMGVFYGASASRNQFLNDQIMVFSEINTEITSVLYYQSNADAADIDYSKTLLYRWLHTRRVDYGRAVPNIVPEVNFLAELGRDFYENTGGKEMLAQNYQNLSDQLDLLKRVTLNTVHESVIFKFNPIYAAIAFAGIWVVFIGLTVMLSNALSKKIVIKNEFILEDIWNEIQGLDLALNSEASKHSVIDYPDAGKIRALIEDSRNLEAAVSAAAAGLEHYSIPIQQQHPQEEAQDFSNIEEKLLLIQKLLSRMFTRAERASTLAKAASENGFQAGILALNISIEAARAGDAGRNFMPISDRVKEFAEKSDQIAKAILEELQDADLSVRKAYAAGKSIADELNNTPAPVLSHTPADLSGLAQSFENIHKLNSYIYDAASALDTTISVPDDARHLEFLKELITRSFERLYRYNYGVDPSSTPFSKKK